MAVISPNDSLTLETQPFLWVKAGEAMAGHQESRLPFLREPDFSERHLRLQSFRFM